MGGGGRGVVQVDSSCLRFLFVFFVCVFFAVRLDNHAVYMGCQKVSKIEIQVTVNGLKAI